MALLGGSVDCVIIDNEPAKALVAANAGLNILETAYANEDYAICVKKGNAELLEKINNAIMELTEDGTIDAIIDKYIEDSKMTSDMAVRTENLQACNAVLQEQAYVQPIFHNTNLFCYNELYTGVTRDPGGTFYLIDMDYAK